MRVSEQINKTKATLFEEGWSQAVVSDEGHLCILQARQKAIGDERHWNRATDDWDFAMPVVEAIATLFPARGSHHASGHRIWAFNDHLQTTFNDVIDVLDLAEKKALVAEEQS